MQTNISSIISALRIIKKENPKSEAIELLEDALKKSMEAYVMDMVYMGTVIEIEQLEEQFKNGLKILGFLNDKE